VRDQARAALHRNQHRNRPRPQPRTRQYRDGE
jgi:hypothetical protein